MGHLFRLWLAILLLLYICGIDFSQQFAFPGTKSSPKRWKTLTAFRNITKCQDDNCSSRIMDSKALAELVRIKNLILDILKRNTKRVPTPQPTVTGVQATIKMPKIPILVSLSEQTNTTDDDSCMQFQLPNGVDKDAKVTGGHLYIYIIKKGKSKQKRLKLRVSTIKPNGRNKVISKLRVRVKSTMWQKMPLPISIIEKFTKSRDSTLKLCIRCKRCNKNYKIYGKRRSDKLRNSITQEKRPFLIIHTKESVGRVERSVGQECTDCCRLSTYLSFRDFAWDNWIVSPQGYTLTECRGSCEGNASEPFKQGHQTRWGRTPEQIDGQTRCRPSQTSHMYLVYFDSDMNLAYKVVPDANIDECSCV